MTGLKLQTISPFQGEVQEFFSPPSLPGTAFAGKHGIFHAYYAYFQGLARIWVKIFSRVLKILLSGSLHSWTSLSHSTQSGSHLSPSQDSKTMDFCLNSSHTVLGGPEGVLRPYKHKIDSV